MQGKKIYQEKLFHRFQLSDYVPKENFCAVEPVFGTLTQFMGLRKINTIGIAQANKVMYMAAIAYNLKKYLKFTKKRAKSKAEVLTSFKNLKNALYNLITSILSTPKNRILQGC